MPSWKDIQDQIVTTGAPVVSISSSQSLQTQMEKDFGPTVSGSDSSLTPPQQQALEKFKARAPLIIQDARAISVISPESKQAAASMRQDIRAAMDLLEAFKRPEINRAHKMHKDALGELKSLLAPWETADAILKKAQDEYELQLRRERQEAARKIEEEMRRAREEALKKQMEEAERKEDVAQILEVVERQEAPLPSIPVVHTSVKVEGGSTRTVASFNLLDVDKIDPRFIILAIKSEIRDKGECGWLMQKIGQAVRLHLEDAVRIVGEGSIEYVEGVSTGVRRKK